MSRCAAGLLLCAVARAGRTRTPLTFGWKFHLGDVSESGGNDGNETLLCPADAFQQFDGMVCPGWAHNGAYHQTEAAGPDAFQSSSTNIMLSINRSFIVSHGAFI